MKLGADWAGGALDPQPAPILSENKVLSVICSDLGTMDAQQVRQTAKQNNNKLILGAGAAALLGYYMYKKRQGDVANVGDAVSGHVQGACKLGFAPKHSLSPTVPRRPTRPVLRLDGRSSVLESRWKRGLEVGGQGLRGKEVKESLEKMAVVM